MRTIVAAVVFVVTASPLLLAQWPKFYVNVVCLHQRAV